MPNTLTDNYSLVKTSTLDVNFIQILLGKTVNYNDGFCRELFRDGKHQRSLRSPTDSFSARKGDTMLTVNMGVVTVPFADKIATRDPYFIAYDATVRLIVLDPRTFAVCYVQGIDPLQKTVDTILAALKREVARGQHDHMSDVFLRGVVENDTGSRRPLQTQLGWRDVTPVEEYGIAIVDAQTMSPYADPKRTAEIEEAKRVERERERGEREKNIELAQLRQQEILQAERLRVQDELAQQQHEIDVRLHQESLDKDSKQWEHDLIKQEQEVLRKAVVGMKIDAMKQQTTEDRALLQRLREAGIPTTTIVREYPELRYLLERHDIVSGKLLNEAELEQLTTSVVEVESLRTHTVIHSNGIWTIGHFSIKVSSHALTEREAELAQTSVQSLGYLVEDIIGPGQHEGEAGLQPQDLIYQIDDESLRELDNLGPYLDECQRRGNDVKVTYLRDEISWVTKITIPPA